MRSQPFLILQSPLSKRYYLAVEYTEYDGKAPMAYDVRLKHDITEQVEALLQRERGASSESARRLVERVPQPEGGFIELDADA